MRKLVLLIVIVFSSASCAMPIEPSTDVDSDDPEVEGIEHNSWCFGFPYMVMSFPQNQGAWKGDVAGQIAYTPFWSTKCPPYGETMPYGQNDGKINLVNDTALSYNTCSKISRNTVRCGTTNYVCPANACLAIPALWQFSPNAPDNSQIWGWANPSYTMSPGNHGIWPLAPTQCANSAPTIQLNPHPLGGAVFSCEYPMGAYYLKQF